MIKFIAKHRIPNYNDFNDPAVQRGYGTLCGIMGVVLNILQSLTKLLVGFLASSVAIVADGVNNLSDAASSIVTLWGFHQSGRRADEDHPFGHGRTEYVAGVVVAVLVLVIGLEIITDSIRKMIHPEPVTPNLVTFLVLVASVLLKLYMFYYNRHYGQKVGSPTLKAVAVDSISDVFVTLVVILAMAVSRFTTLNVDAYGGFLVGLFVIFMGVNSFRETISPLIGDKPDAEFVEQVQEIVERQPHVLGVHDIVVHDYGRGVRYVSLHVEMPGDSSLVELHDEIDFAEHRLRKELGCQAVIHMDPAMERTEETLEVQRILTEMLAGRFEVFDLQHVRIVEQSPKNKLIFEVDVPTEIMEDAQALRAELKQMTEQTLPEYSARVTLDHKYV